MVHGVGVDSEFFDRCARELARWFVVTTYDRRGYGRSDDARDDDYSPSAQADDLAAVIADVGVPAHVVAHSGGAVVVAALLEAHAELVGSVLLHEPALEWSVVAQDDRWSDVRERFGEVAAHVEQGDYIQAMLSFSPLYGEPDPRAQPATSEEAMTVMRDTRAFLRHDLSALHDYDPSWETVASKVVAVGLGDINLGTIREDLTAEMARRLHAPLAAFPGAHNAARDLPREFAWICAGALLGEKKP